MFPKSRGTFALAAYSSIAAVLASPASRNNVARAAQASTNLCGDYDYIILDNSPWIVYNMLYNADEIVGSQCTYYDSMSTSSSGTAEVLWNSETDITYVESTNNVPKGYSFVGLTQNLENRLSDIGSIPTTYEWTRTNTTAFKGNVCFDFMTNDVKGDSTSSDSHELMLWLEYEGGQLPIGWTGGSVATVDLFGTTWDLYEGVNDDTGITVSSLLPTTQFEGSFTGDLKDWLLALANLGKFSDTTYVNVGNAGTEFFYGSAVMNATLALQIDLGSDTTTSSTALPASTSATSVAVSTLALTSIATSAVESTSAASSTIAVVSTSAISSAAPASSSASATSAIATSAIVSSSSAYLSSIAVSYAASSSTTALSSTTSSLAASSSTAAPFSVPVASSAPAASSSVVVSSVPSSLTATSLAAASSAHASSTAVSSIAPISASAASSTVAPSTTLATSRRPHRSGFPSHTFSAPAVTATSVDDDDTCEA